MRWQGFLLEINFEQMWLCSTPFFIFTILGGISQWQMKISTRYWRTLVEICHCQKILRELQQFIIQMNQWRTLHHLLSSILKQLYCVPCWILQVHYYSHCKMNNSMSAVKQGGGGKSHSVWMKMYVQCCCHLYHIKLWEVYQLTFWEVYQLTLDQCHLKSLVLMKKISWVLVIQASITELFTRPKRKMWK